MWFKTELVIPPQYVFSRPVDAGKLQRWSHPDPEFTVILLAWRSELRLDISPSTDNMQQQPRVAEWWRCFQEEARWIHDKLVSAGLLLFDSAGLSDFWISFWKKKLSQYDVFI